MVFRKDITSRARARADEDKAQVRHAFVTAGRRLLATEGASKVSLRRIAAEAGYAPGAIYSYFADSRALYRAVRERDMEDAIEVFQELVSTENEPLARVRSLFVGTVKYWLSRPDHFDVLFSMPANQLGPIVGTELFGQTPVVVRALEIYYQAVDAFFVSLPSHPFSPRLAADSLLAAVYGLIAFPRMTQTMNWSDTAEMAEVVIDSMLNQWVATSRNDAIQ
jgi:AcrR family transcriptional regulator